MPVDRGEIDAQLREIGEGERWWEESEFRELPYILHPDERLRAITRGRVLGQGVPGIRRRRGWLIVATDQRLIMLKQERHSRRQLEISAGHITRVRYSSRLRSAQLTIEGSQRRIRLRIPKEDAVRFSGALAPLIPNRLPLTLPPDLEPLSWIPGITTVASLPGVASIVSRVSRLSPPEPPPAGRTAQLEAAVERLQNDVERLQQQVEFLEELLEQRTDRDYQGPPSFEPVATE